MSMIKKSGKLIFVGLGIKSISHVTIEAQGWIKQSDIVIHHLVDPLTEKWINKLNRNNFSLSGLYQLNKPRIETYKEMVKTILEPVEEGKTVCVAMYGNPAFYVHATHLAAKKARKKGHYVEINPGISSLDCLLADIDMDIVNEGLQILEATSILCGYKKIDPSSNLIIMQPGPVGEPLYKRGKIDKDSVRRLVKVLVAKYGLNHYIYIYNAAIYSISQPFVKKCRLSYLEKHFEIYLSTLYVPPLKKVI
jgi:precorrin-2 methylase